MKSPLKVYDIELTVKGPVFVGDGQELKKKEYIKLRGSNKVVIPKLDRMYADLCYMGKQREYEKYMLMDNEIRLGDWIQNQRIPDKYIDSWKDYELHAGDAIIDKDKTLQVMTCVKDAYGNPYIPGSSLKGMLRTILLTQDICKNPGKFRKMKDEIETNIKRAGKVNRTQFLNKEDKELEVASFHSLRRKENKRWEMVNDYMAGIIVSDSEPLSTDDLTLCQKVEYYVNGREKRLPLLRECIKPNTKIRFQLTIDTSIGKTDTRLNRLDENEIMQAIANFSNLYYDVFVKKFRGLDIPSSNTVWLGGGVGYVSKTVLYALFGSDLGMDLVSKMFYLFEESDNHKNNNKKKHKNDNDTTKWGVSPHIYKMTQYEGKRLPFGQCEVKITKVR